VCGTSDGDPSYIIPLALRAGYRHFDGAMNYGKDGVDEEARQRNQRIYLEKFAVGLSIGLEDTKLTREDIKITFKDDYLKRGEYIEKLLKNLGLQYIDTFLIHHAIHDSESYKALDNWLEQGYIRAWGLSNCETINDVTKYATQKLGSKPWTCAMNQLQISAPNQLIVGRETRAKKIIEICNSIGISTMLFSPISGVTQNFSNFKHVYDGWNTQVMRYYLQKYIWNKPNWLLVGSVFGSSLTLNQELLHSTCRMDAREMAAIETWLEQKIILKRM